MQWIILKLGWVLQTIMGTTVCESINSAANTFLGMVKLIYHHWKLIQLIKIIILILILFFYQSEAPLLIKPYISKLTSSEIHAIMCSGFATVSGEYKLKLEINLTINYNHENIKINIIILGTVLAAYISFGAQPSLLITASVMSAPAALCFSKLFYPETENSQTTFQNIPLQKS